MIYPWKKRIVSLLVLLGLAFPYNLSLAAFKVAENEVKSSDAVDFENYQGPSPRNQDSPATIQGIGEYLAGNPDTQQMNYNEKYDVSKVRDIESNLFSADVVSILPDARVNTIRNIRRIITGYLQSSYNYNYQDAFVLAIFTTYYNALLRTNKQQFQTRYSDKVIRIISSDEAGLATSYQDWAGNSKIIIPVVNDELGGGINAFEVGNSDVNEALRQEKGQGIPEREAIVGAQKDQLVQEKVALDDAKQQNLNDQAQLKQENDQLKADLAKATTPEQKEIIQAAINKNEEKQQVAQKKQEDLIKQDQVIEQQEEQLKENEKSLTEDKAQNNNAPANNTQAPAKNNNAPANNAPAPAKNNNAPANNAPAPAKNNNAPANNAPAPAKNNNAPANNAQAATQERVATLEQKVQEQQVQLDRNEKIEGQNFYYLEKISYFNGTNKDSSLIMVDAVSRKVVKRSPLKTISGNRFDIFDKGIVLIARENPKADINHLTLLDKNSLVILKVGKEDIYSDGMVRVEGEKIYAIFKKDGEFFLGNFTPDLELVSTSSVAVDKDTFLSFYQGKVYLADENGVMMILNADNLILEENGRISE